MRTVKNGTAEYLCSDGIPVPHSFTTRLGGVSTGHLASMNIGIRRGDDPENVRKNYEILGNLLGFDPEKLVLSHQTHTDITAVVGAGQWGCGLTKPELAACDALITNTPGTTLVVFTADCTPILLYDRRTGAVGAVHAGWKGTAQDIAAKTVKAMVRAFGTDPADVIAAIGPNIGQCCFETHRDVPEALEKVYGSTVWEYIRTAENGKFFPDLKKINAFSLHRAGVTRIDMAADCTKCRPDRFWSARITGNARGSQGALITCQGDTL